MSVLNFVREIVTRKEERTWNAQENIFSGNFLFMIFLLIYTLVKFSRFEVSLYMYI